MAKHPLAGFDELIARAAAILEAEGTPTNWKRKGRSWYACQIVAVNGYLLAAIAEGDARRAATFGVWLGGLIREAGAPDLNPRHCRGGARRGARKVAAEKVDFQRKAEEKAEGTRLRKAAVARLMAPGDPKKQQRIRKAIKKTW